MQVIIVGCGRVGAATAAELARAGHGVVVIDRELAAFRLLPRNFGGRTLVGTGFDREVLESAGISEADVLVAATGGDNTNAVTARVAKDVYRVPYVIARIFDPLRADIYRRYGVQTFAPTAWSVAKIIELILTPGVAAGIGFGNGEVQLLSARAPIQLVGRPIKDLESPGEIRVALIVRLGRALLPVSGTTVEEGDTVHVAVLGSAIWKFQRMMGWKS